MPARDELVPIQVVVADSSRIHTQLLAGALSREPDLHVTPAYGAEQVTSIAAANTFDVAVISSYLEEDQASGSELVRKLRSCCPKARAILLLDSTKRDLVLEAFAAGARGIFQRHESLETLAQGIRQVHRGEIWSTPEQMGFAVEALAAAPRVRAVDAQGTSILSKRELEVVRSLAAGLTNREIGDRLQLSQHTVKNYLVRIFEKLGVTSRVELLSLTLNENSSVVSSFESFISELRDADNADIPLDMTNWRKAAEHGVPQAQLKMAAAFTQGRGVPKDPITSYMWYCMAEKSIAELSEKISMRRRILAQDLSTDDIFEAQKLAAKRSGISEIQHSAEPPQNN
jgi:two-component system, NarL family, nitrate/nitrite response regulator NarL